MLTLMMGVLALMSRITDGCCGALCCADDGVDCKFNGCVVGYIGCG